MRSHHLLLLLAFSTSPVAAAQSLARPNDGSDLTREERGLAPLPRWREGGTPQDDPARALRPFAVRGRSARMPPGTGTMEAPPEYTPTEGVLFRYHGTTWPTVVRDSVAALPGDPLHDEIAYVVVANATQQNSATNAFVNAGADMSKVVFIVGPTDSIWLRDYGPHFVWQS